MIKHEILNFTHKNENYHDCFDALINHHCFNIVNEIKDLDCLNNEQLRSWMQLNKFIIFGTGGSSLCGQCIKSISKTKKIVNFVSNLDPDSLSQLFNNIDIPNTGFLFISKSGETLETISQLILMIQLISSNDKNTDLIKSRFVIITEDKESSIKKIAIEHDILCLDHPKDIGGRFSAFSIVGMLPAKIMDVDPISIRRGGRYILENCIDTVITGANFVANNVINKKSNHISFIYSDKLMIFGEWLAQLYAESTGKDKNGVTPFTARGSVDQHSQLQLYLDGIKDKCFTFFFENQNNKSKIEDSYIPSNFNYIKNKYITDIFKSQCDATISCMLEHKFNVRKIDIDAVSPDILGSMFMHFMLEVHFVCKILNVDTFNQPAVERGKILTKQLLIG